MPGSQINAPIDNTTIPHANNWMSNGFNANTSNAFVDDKSFTSVFGQPESNQSCPAPNIAGKLNFLSLIIMNRRILSIQNSLSIMYLSSCVFWNIFYFIKQFFCFKYL